MQWRREQEAAVHMARKTEEHKLLSHKVCILRHDEDPTGAPRVDRAVGDNTPAFFGSADTGAAGGAPTAAGADVPASAAPEGSAPQGEEQEKNEKKEETQHYTFCPHSTLIPTFAAIATYTAYDTTATKQEEKAEETKLRWDNDKVSHVQRERALNFVRATSNGSPSNSRRNINGIHGANREHEKEFIFSSVIRLRSWICWLLT